MLETKLMSSGGSESTHCHLEYDGNVYGSSILAACKCKMQRVCEFSSEVGGSEPTGKSFRFVRACVRAVWLSSRNGAWK